MYKIISRPTSLKRSRSVARDLSQEYPSPKKQERDLLSRMMSHFSMNNNAFTIGTPPASPVKNGTR